MVASRRSRKSSIATCLPGLERPKPIHDWARVTAGTGHAFHLSWIAEIQLVRNDGLLPTEYYAPAEPIAGPLGPDVLTL
jgi:hypothetical protein